MLEAIEHNTRALAFYKQQGFSIRCRLISASTPLEPGHGPGKVHDICLSEMASRPILRDAAVSTWEMNSTSVGQMAHPIVGYECEGLAAAVALRADENVVCFSLAPSGEDDARKLRSLIYGLGETFPGRTFRIPPYYPEPAFLGLFESAGLEIGTLSQVLMERSI